MLQQLYFNYLSIYNENNFSTCFIALYLLEAELGMLLSRLILHTTISNDQPHGPTSG